MVQTVKQKQVAKRVSVSKKTHERTNKERLQKSIDVKATYAVERDKPLLNDILNKAKLFMSYHVKVAQDGVGARTTGYKLENGQQETETIYLTSEQRANHLDKAAGIQELVDYIERQFEVPSESALKKVK